MESNCVINRENLRRVILLRKCIKSITTIIRTDHADFSVWAAQIDLGVEQYFEKYLDEPTQQNYETFGSFWHSTAPIIKQIIENSKKTDTQ